ncbi:MAG: DUF4190 domain-containing protein [Planctomycetota bacterium]
MTDQRDEANPYASPSFEPAPSGLPNRDWNRPMPGERTTNVVGLIGFILSITCCLSPIGLIVSLIALAKPPRGLAIAGVIVGLIGSVLLGFGILSVVAVIAGGHGVAVAISTQADAEALDLQIGRFESEEGRLPTSLDEVHLPPASVIDAWGNEYAYEVGADGSWSLTSAGPDGVFDTSDDFDARALANGSADPSVMQTWQEAGDQGNAPVVDVISATFETAEIQQWLINNESMPASADKASGSAPAP